MRMTIGFDESQFEPMTVEEIAKDIASVLETAIEGKINIFSIKTKEEIQEESNASWEHARFNGG